MLITLAQIKTHLNIDSAYTADDAYITFLEGVAEELVEKHIDKPLTEITAEEGAIPQPLLSAMLLIIGNLYDNRESNSYTSVYEVPNSLSYILSLYRDYKNANI